jgi:hypothetical protein
MIVSGKPNISNTYASLGTHLSSSEKFTKVRILVNTGVLYVGDSNMNTGNDSGYKLNAGDSILLEFDYRDDPASNLFLGTSGSALFHIIAY